MRKRAGETSKSYAAMVAEAEASVSAVKDPELRRVAFEKILLTLLEGGRSKPLSQEKKRGRAPAAAKGNDKAARNQARGPKRHVEDLIDDGFFDTQRTIAEVKAELANGGYHIALTSLSGPLQKLTQERRLRRQKAAKGSKGSKAAFAYSNW